MIKKLSLISFMIIYGASQACAINVLQENATLRGQLNNLSNKQQKENRKNILYYKGRSSYSGIYKGGYTSYPSNANFEQKNIYEKKGVKFKIDTQKQEEKLKEIQSQEKDVKSIAPVETEKTVVKDKKTENESSSKSANHNDDAE